ncbi:MAG: folate-binding protein [Rhodospirillales bacterium]|nr:folate-binding protein [Rhodospirillales bacterium]MSP80290.1 folate-binding protein [Rhodospirillales bacterium]
MSAPRYAILEDRGVLALTGEDTRAFLQGLVSNDVTRVTPAGAVWAALLTPQGKFMHDFFVAELAGAILLECEKARLADLKRRLGLYKLRAKVALDDRSDAFAVAALFGEGTLAALGIPEEAGAARTFADGVVFADPRLASAGARAIAPRDGLRANATKAGFAEASAADYDRARIALGLPDGSRDLEIEKAILLENGFEELNGIDWNKGCYMGQELTARTKYRGLVRKRLMPVAIEGPAPAPGTPIMAGNEEAGEMRSNRDGLGLALLRLEKIEAARAAGIPLLAGQATLTPRKPAWAKF